MIPIVKGRKPGRGYAWVIVFLCWTALIFYQLGCQGVSPHIKRGKEMLSIGEFKNAESEFKLVLKENPKDATAKGLLFYTQTRADEDIDHFSKLLDVFMCADAERDKKIARDEINKLRLKIRNDFYENVLETDSWQEMENIVRVAGRQAYEQEEPEKSKTGKQFKIVGATIAAKAGDKKAVNFLLKMLKETKDDWNSYLYAYWGLLSVGKSASVVLNAELKNKESLLKEQAEVILTRLEVLSVLSAFQQEFKNARRIREEDVTKEIYNRYFKEGEFGLTVLLTTGTTYFSKYSIGAPVLHSYIINERDTTKPLKILCISGLDQSFSDSKFFITFYRWDSNNKRWDHAKIKLQDGREINVYRSSEPIVKFESTKDGYDIVAATSEVQTLYRTETDWSTYPPVERRIPYIQEGLMERRVSFVWQNGVLVAQKEPEKKESK